LRGYGGKIVEIRFFQLNSFNQEKFTVNLSIKTLTLIAGLVASAIMMSSVARADAIDVKNVADPVRHPYQQTSSIQCQPSPQSCLVVFPAITTARTVVLHASCFISAVDSQAIWFVSMTDSTLQIPSYLPINKNADIDRESFYSAVSDPYAFFETGQQPTIQVFVVGPPSAVGVSCTVAGYYL
jgi:hypothetical protein